MKTIKFIEVHPAGIPEGKIVTRKDAFCDRMIAEGYAEEIPTDALSAATEQVQETTDPETAKAVKALEKKQDVPQKPKANPRKK